jgi:Tol biopolymer transport system component
MKRNGWICLALLLCPAACVECPPPPEEPEAAVQHPTVPEWPRDWKIDLSLGTGATLPGPLPAQDMWRDLRGETPMIAEPERAVQPDVSRDGRLLVYARKMDDGTWQIFKQELGPGGANPASTKLTYTGANHLFPRLSPDGKWIAYASDRAGNWDIVVASIDSPSAVQPVCDGPRDEICPSWSADMKRLGYAVRTERGHWQIAWADRATRVHTYLGAGIYPDWHPKEDRLVFQSQPGVPADFPVVTTVNADGTALKTVAEAPDHGCVMPRWSQDGRWIVYASIRHNRDALLAGAIDEADDLWAIKPDGTDRARLSDDPMPQWWPTMTSSGRLYFVARHEGHQRIFSAQIRPLDWSTHEDSGGR